MGPGCRLGDPARQLFHVELALAIVIECEHLVRSGLDVLKKRETRGRFIPGLDLALREIDRPAVYSAGRPCLEAAHGKAQLAQIVA